MVLSQRIQAFSILGKLLSDIVENPQFHDDFFEIATKAERQNPWFTKTNILQAISGIAFMLDADKLTNWLQAYAIENNKPKRVAVIMAGNIPLVGFHDALCVLITGNILVAKLSSKDSTLMTYVLQRLCEIEPKFKNHYELTPEMLPKFDAIISTGSNNSARYFEYYFKKYPYIIRKNRNSVAVILESDTTADYKKIGKDMFDYFGLGCRNVSKLFVPEGFNMVAFLDELQDYVSLTNHNKFMNNYDYNRSIYLLSQIEHLDTGYALFKVDKQYNSPLAVIHYETYSTVSNLDAEFIANKDSLQCIVCSKNIFTQRNVLPGTTQSPDLSDYADNIDTIKFLTELV